MPNQLPDKILADYQEKTEAPLGLTAQHIATNLAYYEAARTGFFSFIIDFKNSTDDNTALEDAFQQLSIDKQAAQEYIALNVTKASVPNFSLETLEYTRGNEKVKFAGVPTWKDGSITVDDVVGLNTKSILYAWKGLAYNVKTRKGGRMKDYKKTCTLVEYTQDYEKIREWTLYGCFITEISDEDFDRESDGKRQLTATIVYDRAEMKLPEEEKE